jgi:hypothetical protein
LHQILAVSLTPRFRDIKRGRSAISEGSGQWPHLNSRITATADHEHVHDHVNVHVDVHVIVSVVVTGFPHGLDTEGLWGISRFSFAASEHCLNWKGGCVVDGLRDDLLDWLAEINLEPFLARHLKLAWVES